MNDSDARVEAPLGPQAQVIWDGLELRAPTLLGTVDRLEEAEFQWQPPNGANSIAWLLWHIAEVEDNWVREKLLTVGTRYPFGSSVRVTAPDRFPGKGALVDYFREVRALTRARLSGTSEPDFDRVIVDDRFGSMTVRQLWAGVVTSAAWHGGQIVMIANRMILPRRLQTDGR